MNITEKLSPNFTSGRDGRNIDLIVIHWIGAGTADSAANWFSKTSSKVSAHYIVGDSSIYRCVNEQNTAWHAGDWEINLRSVGIEHEATPDKPATENVYKKSAELIADICKRYDIPIDRDHIIGHSDVKATACPGTMDIGKLIAMARGDEMDDCERRIDKINDELVGVRESRDKWKRDYKELEDKYEREVRERNEHIESLQNTVSELNAQGSTLTLELKRIQNEITTVKEEKNVTQANLEAFRDRNSELSDKLESLEKEIKKLKEKIKDKTVFAFSWRERFFSLFKGGVKNE